jgi:ABC-type sugar transport system, periplasmic component
MKKVTIYDLARELGVSVGTIDRALHNRSDISDETRNKVMKLVDKYGYKPNRVARHLSLNNKKYKIGVMIPGYPEFYWGNVKRGIRSAENDLSDFGLEVILLEQNNNRTFSDVVEKVEILIESNVDAMALVPPNNRLITGLISDVSKKGIPVATINDDIEDSDRIFYVGPLMKQSGRIVGELMGKLLGGKGKVIIISGVVESFVYHERVEGFREILEEKYKDVKIAANCTCSYGVLGDDADVVIKGILENMNDISGIYNVDGASLYKTGCLLRDMGLSGKINLIGHEIFDKVEQLIIEGHIQACISQDPYLQGYHTIRHMFKYLTEKKLPTCDRLYTRLDVILKENLVDRECMLNPYY